MTMNLDEIKRLEEETLANTDPAVLEQENREATEDIDAVCEGAPTENSSFSDILNCLPTNRNGILEPRFWRYYMPPWCPGVFFDFDDPYNDLVTIVWGPRGGGKTITGVSISIIDGNMKGIPTISNVPFSWAAKDVNGKLYKVESLPFDQEAFARGDPSLKYKRLVIDEGNYLADRLRSTSNKNLAMTDILQQARKFRMCVIFCTINWMWLDPRVTGSLCDILIESNDLYYRSFGRRAGLKKGHRIAWDMYDQSGKTTGHQFRKIGSTTFNARLMWNTYNTENFVDPREARKRLQTEIKMITDEFGLQISQVDWLHRLEKNIKSLSHAQPIWDGADLWAALGIDDPGLRVKAGRFMRSNLGVEKNKNREGYSQYDLSEVV